MRRVIRGEPRLLASLFEPRSTIITITFRGWKREMKVFRSKRSTDERGEAWNMKTFFCPECGANIGPGTLEVLGCPLCGYIEDWGEGEEEDLDL